MEGDTLLAYLVRRLVSISIHSLRMEGDICDNIRRDFSIRFQSTPSAWRETVYMPTYRNAGVISIHSLRMEGDIRSNVEYQYQHVFQSTPSAWRETQEAYVETLELLQFQSTPSAWRETSRIPRIF